MTFLWNTGWAASVKSTIASWITHKDCPLNPEEKLYVAAEALRDHDLAAYEKVLNWQVNLKGWMKSWQRAANVPMPSIYNEVKAKISTEMLGFKIGRENRYDVMTALDKRRFRYIKGSALDPYCTIINEPVIYVGEKFDEAHIAYGGAGGTIEYVLFSKRMNEPELSTFRKYIIDQWFDGALVYKSLKKVNGKDVTYSDGVTDIIIQQDSSHVFVHVKRHELDLRYY